MIRKVRQKYSFPSSSASSVPCPLPVSGYGGLLQEALNPQLRSETRLNIRRGTRVQTPFEHKTQDASGCRTVRPRPGPAQLL
ncbi:unnamed protein product [Pleuronectes platessa]|uniref:Uncharacterized protein n=1 Tax=Pleuronectes platessa TaxID=8262 RepID=A0A9N7U8Z0_PLEPL|nr:unnamed protein product [Pleuronectes platessa]